MADGQPTGGYGHGTMKYWLGSQKQIIKKERATPLIGKHPKTCLPGARMEAKLGLLKTAMSMASPSKQWSTRLENCQSPLLP